MTTDQRTVTANGLQSIQALASGYDAAVSTDPDNGAAQFVASPDNAASIYDTAGNTISVKLGLQDGSETSQGGNATSITTWRGQLGQILAVFQDIAQGVATDGVTQANLQSGDGQYMFVFTLSMPGQNSGPGGT